MGPIRDLHKYKVETDWYGVQEFRQEAYMRWAEILEEHKLSANPRELVNKFAGPPVPT